MDESYAESVEDIFIDLYKKGKIYRGVRMVNWDPSAKTALSDEEVIHKEVNSKLYNVRYQIEGTDEWLTIATTRPETILGDRKSTRLNSSHVRISYAVFCLKKKKIRGL